MFLQQVPSSLPKVNGLYRWENGHSYHTGKAKKVASAQHWEGSKPQHFFSTHSKAIDSHPLVQVIYVDRTETEHLGELDLNQLDSFRFITTPHVETYLLTTPQLQICIDCIQSAIYCTTLQAKNREWDSLTFAPSWMKRDHKLHVTSVSERSTIYQKGSATDDLFIKGRNRVLGS